MTIQWTGERFIPGVGPDIAYEHYSRYLFAKNYCEKKSVLDVPAGEGFGSAILAQVAKEVIGLDVSEEAVQHAQSSYQKEGLRFATGDMGSLDGITTASIDLITCFEGIEHVDEATQRRALAEFERVLRPDGLLLISSPNRRVYSDIPKYKNEFHVHEFYADEFRQYLGEKFKSVRLFGHKITEGAVVYPLDSENPGLLQTSFIEFSKSGDEKLNQRIVDPDQYMYLIAVCSKQALSNSLPHGYQIMNLERSALSVREKRMDELFAETEKLSAEIARLQYRLDRKAHKFADRVSDFFNRFPLIKRMAAFFLGR